MDAPKTLTPYPRPAENDAWTTTRFDDDITALLGRNGARRFDGKPVMFYGSSSFRLWHRMAEDLNCLDVINASFGGGTMESALRYADRVFAAIEPRSIVVYFGENDVANDGLSAEMVIRMYLALRQRIREVFGRLPIYYASSKHSPTRWLYKDQIDELNRLAKQACDDDPDSVYVDCTSCLMGQNGLPISRYYRSDYLHLNDEGYSRWAEALHAAPGLFATQEP